jgi:3-hydroxyisobutyrate dehydrogenase
MTETLTVLGAGTMGEPIARNLLAAGFGVRVWNRTREKADELARSGATVCDTPAEAAAGSRFVLTLVANADAVRETVEAGGALAAMADGAVWIQLSTVGVAAAEELGRLAAEHGVAYVDAPVLGSRVPAERRELVVLASGPEELRARCLAVFEAIGKKTLWLGEAGRGSSLKLVANMWLLAVNEAAAEAIAFAEKLGLDPRLFLDTMKGSQIDTPYLHLKAEKILERSFEPTFKLALAEKDARLVLEAAAHANVELPAAAAVQEQLARAVELGHGDEDMAAAYFATADS